MAFKVHGYSGTVLDVGGTGFRAVKAEPRPIEVAGLGSYRTAVISGTMTGASNSDVWSMRWTDNVKLACIHKVTIDGLGGTSTAFTAGLGNIKLFMARAFLADGSGGSRLPTSASAAVGNQGKMKTSHNTMGQGELRWAATGGGSFGTGALDSQPIGQYTLAVSNTASKIHIAKPVALFESKQHPIILAANEGVAVRMTMPSAGTWHHSFTVVWSEILAY